MRKIGFIGFLVLCFVICACQNDKNEVRLEILKEVFSENEIFEDSIKLDYPNGIPRFTIELKTGYVHSDWDSMVADYAVYSLVSNGAINGKTEKEIRIRLKYSVKEGIPYAEWAVRLPRNFKEYQNETFNDYIEHIVLQMEPKLFQAYDRVLKHHRDYFNDERFNTRFLNFILQASEDGFLDEEEEFVYYQLAYWAKNSGAGYTVEHFKFFLERLIIESHELEVEDSFAPKHLAK